MSDVLPVEAYVEEVRSEVARTDTKASLLLALSGAGLALVASGPAGESGPAGWLARGGALLIVVAVVLLLLVVRPKLRGAPFTEITEDPEGWEPDTPQGRFANLAGVARSKFARIRSAVSLLVAAVLLVGASVVWAGVTA